MTIDTITWYHLNAEELYEDLLFRRYELRCQYRSAMREYEKNHRRSDLELAETVDSWIDAIEPALAQARLEARRGWNSGRSVLSHVISLGDLLAMFRDR
jgi:hypothetical protein